MGEAGEERKKRCHTQLFFFKFVTLSACSLLHTKVVQDALVHAMWLSHIHSSLWLLQLTKTATKRTSAKFRFCNDSTKPARPRAISTKWILISFQIVLRDGLDLISVVLPSF